MADDKKIGDEAVEDLLDRFSPTLKILEEQQRLADRMWEDAKRDFARASNRTTPK